MEFLPVSAESLDKAAVVLRSGGIVAFPTETVYGLGADAYNPRAITKVFEAKGRPSFDPLIIHIAAVNTLYETADLSQLNEETKLKLFLLADNLWPGPLSIVLPKNKRIPGIATAGLDTAAIRFPSLQTAQTLISLSGGALAAPSANPFGRLSPTRAEHVRSGLGNKVDIILDGGPTQIGLESTVLDLTGKQIRILRPGGTPKEAIEKLIGPVEDSSGEISDGNKAGLVSPGLLKSHYAPKTPLFVYSKADILRQPYETGIAFLFFDDSALNSWLKEQGTQTNKAIIRVLSPSGSVNEAAACLFDTLHELDGLQNTRIFAQFAPNNGLGAAINDRLLRAVSVS